MFEALLFSPTSTTSVCITMSQPNRDTVFPKTEESRLRAHIAILTSALKSVEVEPVPSTDRVRDRKRLRIFLHVYTLLTLGTPGDPWSSRVNAVSGSVDHDQIVSIISTSIHDHPTVVPGLQDSIPISGEKVSGMGGGKQIVKEWEANLYAVDHPSNNTIFQP